MDTSHVLDLLEAGDWKAAHEIVQKESSTLAAWLHGIVHLLEGDLDNARGWYTKAKREFPGADAAKQEIAAARNDTAKGMLELRLSVELGSPADRVWSVVGNFNGLPDWHPQVESSVLEPAAGGIGRLVVNVGGSAPRRELTERLVFYDAAAREYAYTIVAGSAPFVDYVGRFRVVPRGADRCVFEFVGRFNPGPGKTPDEATERIRTFYEAAIENLPRLFGA